MASSSSSSSAHEPITIGVLALQGAFAEHISYLTHCLPPSSSSLASSSRIRPIPVRSISELAQCSALVIPGGESTVIQSVAARTPGLLAALQDFVRDGRKATWGTCAGMILMAEEEGVGGGKVIPGRERQKGWGGIEGLKVWRNLYGNQLESFEAPLIIPDLSNPSEPFPAIFIRAPAVHSLVPTKLEDHTELVDGDTGSGSGDGTAAGSAGSASANPASAPVSGSAVQTHLPTPASTPPRLTSPGPSNKRSGTAIAVVALATLPAEFHPPPPPSDSHLGPSHPADLGKVMLRQGKKMVTSFHPELSGDVRVHRYWVEKCVLGEE